MSLIISANDLIVLAIYSKAGGKNGKHSSPSRNLQTYPPCPTSSYRFSNRWSASNFEQYYQRSCTSSVFLQSKKFTLLPSSSTSFLCTPDTARARSAIETGLRISTTDYTKTTLGSIFSRSKFPKSRTLSRHWAPDVKTTKIWTWRMSMMTSVCPIEQYYLPGVIFWGKKAI
jgi:hypothetical protein